jgi:hypothetical protein
METAAYPSKIRLPSIDGVERHLRQFVHGVIHHSVDTDRRLRGMGYPENVRHCDSIKHTSRAEAEIVRLAHAHRALLQEQIEKEAPKPARFLSRKWLEDSYANNKGLIWLGRRSTATEIESRGSLACESSLRDFCCSTRPHITFAQQAHANDRFASFA